MNPDTSKNCSRSPLSLIALAAPTVVLLAILLAVWSNHTKTKDQLNQLDVQNSELEKQLAAAQAAIQQLNSGDSSAATRDRLAQQREARIAPEPIEEKETLLLQKPTVEQVPDALLVHLHYIPDSGIELPDSVTLVVRIPGGTTSRILSLESNSAAEAIVNATGNLGMVECTPSEQNSLDFELKVSEPVTATVRGSEGIIDFEMDIAPDGCTVRKL